MKSDDHHTIRSVAIGAVWRLLRYPFFFLTLVFIPRAMGVTNYGLFAYFLSVHMVCEAFVGMGNIQVFGRFLPEFGPDRRRAAHFLHGILFYGMSATLVFTVAVCAFFLVTRPAAFPPRWTPALALLLLVGKVQGTLFSHLYGRNEIGRFSSRELLRSVFRFVFVLALFLPYGVDGAIWGLVINELALAVVAFAWTKDDLLQPATRVSLREFKPYLLFGLTFYIPTIMLGLLQRSGNIFIQAITGSADQVGFFDLASQFLVLTGTFLGLIFTTLVPALTRMHLADRGEDVHGWTRLALIYCGAAVVIIYTTLVFLGRPAISLVIGPQFAPAHPMAMAGGLALVPMLLAQVGANFALLRKRPSAYLVAVVIGFVAMLLACLILVPKFGGIGAAWGTVAGYAALAAALWAQFRADFSRLAKGFFAVILPGVLLAPACFVNLSLPLAAAVCAAAIAGYLGLLSALGFVKLKHARQILFALRNQPPVKPQV